MSKDNINLTFTMYNDVYDIEYTKYGYISIHTRTDAENYWLYAYPEKDGTWILQVNPPDETDANGERIMPCILGYFDNMIQLLEAMRTAERNRYLFPDLQGYYD